VRGGSTFSTTGIKQETIIAGGGMETPTPEAGILSVPSDMGTGGGGEQEMPATPETEQQIQSILPTNITVEPLILGLQADKSGQIVATYPQLPQEAAPQAEAARPWTKLVTDNVKIAIAGVAALFGLLALALYLRR
jgi:hypothetical protein